MLFSFETYTTFGLLTVALASLGLPAPNGFAWFANNVWIIFLVFAIIAGMLSNFLEPVALLWIILLGVASWTLYQENVRYAYKSISFITVFLLSIALLTHQLPGFANPKIIMDLQLTEDALPYDKYLNFDSALIGLFILGFGHKRLTSVSEGMLMIIRLMPVLLITLLVVMLMSLVLGYVHWQPKWTSIFFTWAWGNLFFTCFIEEAFFRGFIQKFLMQGLSTILKGYLIAIFIAAVLFGLAHFIGGPKYIVLATVAGIGYGYAYHYTQRIEASILTHFTLNSLHFLLFTYPALSASF